MVRIVTYHSINADPGKEWIAFIAEPNGVYLPVWFRGSSEDAARGAAQAEWDKHEKTREENIARREEGRRKAAETRAKKGDVNSVSNFHEGE